MNRTWMKPLAVAAFALTLAAPVSALAADTSVAVAGAPSVTITEPTVANFPSVTLDGTTQTKDASLGAFTVTDVTGTGLGWKVNVSATQFTGGTDAAHTLPAGSLSMTMPTVSPSADTTSPAPTVLTSPQVIDSGSVQIAEAASGTGMGVYDFSSSTLTVTILASSYADSYTSTVTVSLDAAP